jgi:hypothetical protein
MCKNVTLVIQAFESILGKWSNSFLCISSAHVSSSSLTLLTSIQRYSLDSVTRVRRTVGYHIPCKSAGDIGIDVVKLPPEKYKFGVNFTKIYVWVNPLVQKNYSR